MSERTYYHQSALTSYEFCGYAYSLEQIEKKRGLGSYYSCRGSGVHAARKLNLRQKVKTRKDLDLIILQDVCRDEINEQIQGDKIDMKTEPLKGKSKSAASGLIIDTAVRLVDIDRRHLQSAMQPKEVEVHKDILLKSWPFNLGMTLDSIDEDGYITDCKTSKIKWSQEKADSQYQPAVYTLGHRAHYGRDPKAFRYHCLICTNAGTLSAYPLITQVSDARILAVLNRFLAMHKAIEAGIFAPAHSGQWNCSPKWCSQYRSCKYAKK